MNIFLELSLIIVFATVISFVVRLLKQPLIVGYILTGIITGPHFLNILQSLDTIELFSKIGITILLFIIGLSLNPLVIKEVGRVSLITGVGQVLFTSIVGYFIAIFLGLSQIAAIYTAIALTFSSTIIILKLLSDKGDLHKLYGKIAVGFLIVQDVIATIILIVVASFAGAGETTSLYSISLALLKGILILSGLVLVSSRILPMLVKFAARSQELLFLFSIAWGLGFSALFH
ncbi:MAG: cation:proton antiporter, partial [Patescibacteria group bacterium]